QDTSVGCSAYSPSLPPLTYSDVTPSLLADYTVIVNCTPLGMYPKVDAAPPLPYAALSPRHLLFDLVYNPEVTLFMQQGRRFGATVKSGLEMLHLQAVASWEFWNGKD
ncbi:MAG: shikimate dehydrogenase, partial [Bacteroidaceae bacterium]|nr:shikimate dehydrogenase [Bacteroidaceae bacterium]